MERVRQDGRARGNGLATRSMPMVSGGGDWLARADARLAATRTARHALPRTCTGDADTPARLWAKAMRHRLTRARAA